MVTPYKVCMGLVAEDKLTDYNYLYTAVGGSSGAIGGKIDMFQCLIIIMHSP